MNYRHGFHAGNFADVLKHLALCELLRLLTAKDKRLLVLDTHAGAGGYDLGGALARRTREAETGIARLIAAPRTGMPAAVTRYLAAVAAYDRKFGAAGGQFGTIPVRHG
jgi:23S rRNA (adenine2030-N6)-methyltransferase